MVGRNWGSVVLALGVLFSPAWGKDPGIVWSESLQDALRQGRKESKPILAKFSADWCPHCKRMDESTLNDPKVIQLVQSGFIPVTIDGDKQRELTEQYEIEGYPTILCLLPSGESLGKIAGGFVEADTLSDRLRKTTQAVKKMGALDTGPTEEMLIAADKAFEEGKFAVAYSNYAVIAEDTGNPDSEHATIQREKIESMASQLLAELTKKLDAKDYKSAADMLQKLRLEFAGTPAAASGEELVSRFDEDESAKLAKRTAEAAQGLAEADSDFRSARYSMAFDKYTQLARDYSDVRPGQDAAKKLKNMKANEILMKRALDQVAADQAQIWLSLARSWKRSKNRQKANEYYDKIIENFPGTTFADQAEAEKRDRG